MPSRRVAQHVDARLQVGHPQPQRLVLVQRAPNCRAVIMRASVMPMTRWHDDATCPAIDIRSWARPQEIAARPVPARATSASAGTQVSMCTAAVSSGPAPTLRYGVCNSTLRQSARRSRATLPCLLFGSWSTLRATTMMWSAIGDSETNFLMPSTSKPSRAERTSVSTICRSEPPDSSEAPMHSTASPRMALLGDVLEVVGLAESAQDRDRRVVQADTDADAGRTRDGRAA